ncbi:hypothetical protein G647_00022 [Cladophialophora carrionii CBS 160.54]|uniref:Uncharacterized protein n=1 Tax=Cladophialophora carrionii CBS 160.54 TaxID=1279043 RepID=V9DMM5_9EURO|nr:uncharacterized protein G647_00022 [Cladophialophora carrionii CBS 160.54]ETI27573.1 hypothetical protein G647_00022 [Cladophialophora carrionii CBS 160.54]
MAAKRNIVGFRSWMAPLSRLRPILRRINWS